MSKDVNKKTILQISIQEILNQFPDTLAVYLFGSFGTPYERRQSDIDLAVLRVETSDSVALWELAEKIARKANRDVQIVDLNEASTVFRYEIIMGGKRVYCKDERECDFLENVYQSMYLRLNEERAEILNEIRGKNG